MKKVWILVENGEVPEDGVHATLESLCEALVKRQIEHYPRERLQSELRTTFTNRKVSERWLYFGRDDIEVIERSIKSIKVLAS